MRKNGIMHLELYVSYLINHYNTIEPELTPTCFRIIIDVCILIIQFMKIMTIIIVIAILISYWKEISITSSYPLSNWYVYFKLRELNLI